MRIVAVEAVDEILVLVVDAAVAAMVMRLLLLAEALLHSMVHVTGNGTAAGIDIRTSLHGLRIHCDGVILIHFLRVEYFLLSRLKLLPDSYLFLQSSFLMVFVLQVEKVRNAFKFCSCRKFFNLKVL